MLPTGLAFRSHGFVQDRKAYPARSPWSPAIVNLRPGPFISHIGHHIRLIHHQDGQLGPISRPSSCNGVGSSIPCEDDETCRVRKLSLDQIVWFETTALLLLLLPLLLFLYIYN
jgi:hypothetical protein